MAWISMYKILLFRWREGGREGRRGGGRGWVGGGGEGRGWVGGGGGREGGGREGKGGNIVSLECISSNYEQI